MIQLPSNWPDITEHELIDRLLSSAEATGAYFSLARGLMHAYLRDCVPESAIVNDGTWKPDRGGVIRARDFEWRVLSGVNDDHLEWALKSGNPRFHTSIVAPPWTEHMIASAVRMRTGTNRLGVTTLTTLIGLHVFFVSAGERHAARDAIRRIVAFHNAYCVSRELHSAIIIE